MTRCISISVLSGNGGSPSEANPCRNASHHRPARIPTPPRRRRPGRGPLRGGRAAHHLGDPLPQDDDHEHPEAVAEVLRAARHGHQRRELPARPRLPPQTRGHAGDHPVPLLGVGGGLRRGEGQLEGEGGGPDPVLRGLLHPQGHDPRHREPPELHARPRRQQPPVRSAARAATTRQITKPIANALARSSRFPRAAASTRSRRRRPSAPRSASPRSPGRRRRRTRSRWTRSR